MTFNLQANNFTHYRFARPDPRHLNATDQQNHVKNVLKKPERPLSYDRHVHFIDFTQFGQDQPIWFSIIRDPIDKFVSRYYYNRYYVIEIIKIWCFIIHSVEYASKIIKKISKNYFGLVFMFLPFCSNKTSFELHIF